jgi:ssDNA-binding Zn-finger/Zn-ribbon topoisomerase 1
LKSSAKPVAKWDLITLKCGLCGGPLSLKEGEWGCFYGCDDYPKCFNRLNIDIYERILDKITELMLDDSDTNYTGYKWEYKTSHQRYQFKIDKQSREKFIVSVINLKKAKIPSAR